MSDNRQDQEIERLRQRIADLELELSHYKEHSWWDIVREVEQMETRLRDRYGPDYEPGDLKDYWR
jgi:hypothetical protein